MERRRRVYRHSSTKQSLPTTFEARKTSSRVHVVVRTKFPMTIAREKGRVKRKREEEEEGKRHAVSRNVLERLGWEKKEEWKKRTSGVIHTTGLEEDATGSRVDTENKLRGVTLHMSNEVSWCVRGRKGDADDTENGKWRRSTHRKIREGKRKSDARS